VHLVWLEHLVPPELKEMMEHLEMVALLVRMAHPAKMALMEHPDQLAQLDLHPPEHLVMMDNLELLELPEHPEKMVSMELLV